MAPIFFIFIALWFVVALLDYGNFCYFWQLKEYRLDRFKDFIYSKQGKDFLKSYLVSGRALIFVFLLGLWLFDFTPPLSLLTGWLALEFAGHLVRLYKKQSRRPKRTIKAYLIVLIAIASEVGVFIATGELVVVLLLACLRLGVLSVVVGLFFLPTKILKKIYIIKAAKKLRRYPGLKVVGITGSYGKTTVKNFLSQFLSAKFKVVTTPKNINTEIGIAQFILSADFSEAEVFVVEMGAYKMNEIRLICDMVKPKIGILTAINEQHLSLFGDIKNTQKAKYELLFSLPADGLAITNADNPYCREWLDKLSTRVETFGSLKEFKPDCLVKEVALGQDGSLKIIYNFNNEIFEVNAPVVGEHNASNIAPCILTAMELGMTKSEITAQAKQLRLPEGTLQIINYGESVILDDSYNANPDGFQAALKVLAGYDADKKIVITRGMLELGERSTELHHKVGKAIAEVADELIIISGDSEKELREGAAADNLKIMTKQSPADLLEYLKTIKNTKAVVLLENRVPENVLKELRN